MAKGKSTRRYSYAFLTMGGRRWVELTPERFERLYEKEQENILRTAKYTGEDIRQMKKEDWEQLAGLDEIGRKVYTRLTDIARGRVAAQVEDISVTNYAQGIRMAGNEELATVFEALARTFQKKNKGDFDIFMKEIPDLYLFYKDKGKSHVKRQNAYVQETAEEQIEEMEEILNEYVNDIKDNKKLYKNFINEVEKIDPVNADRIIEWYGEDEFDDE